MPDLRLPNWEVGKGGKTSEKTRFLKRVLRSQHLPKFFHVTHPKHKFKTSEVMYKRTKLALLKFFSDCSYVRIVSRLPYIILNIPPTQYVVIFYIPIYKTPGFQVMPALTWSR